MESTSFSSHSNFAGLTDAALKFMEIAEGVPELAGEASPNNKWQHPPSFYCPISQQCMHDPVVLSDGHTYERRHIERWLQEHSTSPVSNEALQQMAIFSNHALRNAIEEYFQQVFSVHRRAIRKTIRGPEASSQSLISNEPLLHTIDALMQCSFLMNADLSTEVVLRQIMDEAKTLLGAEVASVFLVDQEKQELYSRVNSTRGELRVPINAGIAGHVATTGEFLIIHDVYADKRFNRTNDLETGFRTRNMICVPLKVKKGGTLGVVQLINKTNAGVFSRSHALAAVAERQDKPQAQAPSFTLHDMQFLQVFASQAATAVANSGGMLRQPQFDSPSDSNDSVETSYGMCDLMKSCITRPLQKIVANGAEATRMPQESSAHSTSQSSQKETTCKVPQEEPQSLASAQTETELAALRTIEKSADDEDSSPKQKRWRSRISRSFSLLDEVARAVKVTKLLDDATQSWHFDAFVLSELTENKPLSTLGVHLFQHLGFVEQFDFDMQKVQKFFIEIENGYSDCNPYHNRAHAASVLHAMHMLLETGGVAEIISPSFDGCEDSAVEPGCMERMASLLAAAIHDFEHLGVSNDFLVRSCHQRAMLYNDQHVNEHHHVAATFALLSRPECNFLTNLSEGDWRRLRNIIIELVISTDMANGGKILKAFNETFCVPSEGGMAAQPVPASAKDAMLLLQMAIKCADLGHLALSWDVHTHWVSKLEEEFFAQGDREKANGHPISFLMDRSKPGCSKTQTGFFKFVVIPLFRSLVSVAPRAQPIFDAVMANYKGWEQIEAGLTTNEAKEQQNKGTENKKVGSEATSQNDEPLQPERLSAGTEATSQNDEAPQPERLSSGHLDSAGDETPQSRRGLKRSGRARQRAAKWWAAVRRNTPSPEPRSFAACLR